MEYVEWIYKLLSSHSESIFPAVAVIGQIILWREMKLWKRELLALKARVLCLVSIHCQKYTEDMERLLIDPEQKQIEELEKALNK